MFKKLSFCALAALVLATAGCNTVAGAGQDVKDAGQSVQNAADRNK